MTPMMFFSLVAFLLILTFIYKIDNFIKMGIPFILIGITFNTETVQQSESFFITIFFILQIFLSLSLPEKLETKIKFTKMLPISLFSIGVISLLIFQRSKNLEDENMITKIDKNIVEVGSDIYLLVLILVLILFSSAHSKRERKWN